MNYKNSLRVFVVACFLWMLGGWPAQSQNANDYAGLIEDAKSLINEEKPEQAFQKALKAIEVDGNRADAYFYAGVAMYRQDLLDAAEKYVKLALDRAPNDEKQAVNKQFITGTLKAIAEKRDFLARVKVAAQAEQDGLTAKAAREYGAAWKLFPSRSDVGLKAAVLWVDKLSDPIKAVEILHYVAEHPQAPPDAEQANTMLAAMQPALNKLGSEKFELGEKFIQQAQTKQAIRAFEEAIAIQPEVAGAHYQLSTIYAALNDYEAFTKELLLWIKGIQLSPEAVGYEAFYDRFFDDPRFLTFLSDVFGDVGQAKAIAARKKRHTLEELDSKTVEEKLIALRQILKDSPEDTDLKWQLFNTLLAMPMPIKGDVIAAADDYLKKYYGEEKEFYYPLYSLALTLSGTNLFLDEARRYGEKAVPLLPADADDNSRANLYHVLGGIYYQQGDYPDALLWLKKATDIYKTDEFASPAQWLPLAQAEEKSAKTDEALADYLKVAAMFLQNDSSTEAEAGYLRVGLAKGRAEGELKDELEKQRKANTENWLASLRIDKPAPSWTASKSDGSVLKMSDYAGKVVVLFIWSSASVDQIKSLMALQEKYKGRVEFVGLNQEDVYSLAKIGSVQKFMTEKGYNFTTILDHEWKVRDQLDPETNFSSTVHIIDEHGILRYHYGQLEDSKEFNLLLSQVLNNEKAAKPAE